jgi:hypothetical protein
MIATRTRVIQTPFDCRLSLRASYRNRSNGGSVGISRTRQEAVIATAAPVAFGRVAVTCGKPVEATCRSCGKPVRENKFLRGSREFCARTALRTQLRPSFRLFANG